MFHFNETFSIISLQIRERNVHLNNDLLLHSKTLLALKFYLLTFREFPYLCLNVSFSDSLERELSLKCCCNISEYEVDLL